MKILLLGGSGLLGLEFKKALKEGKYDFSAPSHAKLDVTNKTKVQKFMEKNKFDLVIYCVAYTDVDLAETNREECRRLNFNGLENIIETKIPIIHFSTDYVFNAPKNLKIPEDYQRHPMNFYGRTKVLSEILLETSNIEFWNIRTSWLFGSTKDNFVTKILKLSQKMKILKIVGDEIGRPTYTKDLVEFVLINFVNKKQSSGSYHLQSSGDPVSWADFARYFLTKSRWVGAIEKVSAKSIQKTAKRPRNSVLKNTKLTKKLRNWKNAVDDFLKQL